MDCTFPFCSSQASPNSWPQERQLRAAARMAARRQKALLLVAAAAVLLACSPQQAQAITTTGPSCKVAPPPGRLALPRCPATTKTLADAKAGELMLGGWHRGRHMSSGGSAAAAAPLPLPPPPVRQGLAACTLEVAPAVCCCACISGRTAAARWVPLWQLG